MSIVRPPGCLGFWTIISVSFETLVHCLLSILMMMIKCRVRTTKSINKKYTHILLVRDYANINHRCR